MKSTYEVMASLLAKLGLAIPSLTKESFLREMGRRLAASRKETTTARGFAARETADARLAALDCGLSPDDAERVSGLWSLAHSVERANKYVGSKQWLP